MYENKNVYRIFLRKKNAFHLHSEPLERVLCCIIQNCFTIHDFMCSFNDFSSKDRYRIVLFTRLAGQTHIRILKS